MKHFFQQTTEEVLSNLGTTIDGLNDAKVEEQRATYGLSLIHISRATTTFCNSPPLNSSKKRIL